MVVTSVFSSMVFWRRFRTVVAMVGWRWSMMFPKALLLISNQESISDWFLGVLNSGSSTHLYGMRLTAALCNGAVRGQPVDSHVIICHTSVTCERHSHVCIYTVRADLGGHLKYSQRWSGVRAGVLLGVQGAVCRGESRGGL